MHLRLRAALAILGVIAVMGSVALLNPHKALADDEVGIGRAYVTTVQDLSGNFASRGVLVLHADHTMSVTDSGQGGPTFFFSSQLGSWKHNSTGGLVAKTIDFDYPPSADVARLDYTIKFAQNGTQVTGTITLTTFPLQANPLDGGGTVVGNFTFTGQLIQP